MPHFFINSNQVTNNEITISDKENYFHIARSLRARTGESLLLIDENKIQYETTIASITNDKITVRIDKFYPSKRFLDFELSYIIFCHFSIFLSIISLFSAQLSVLTG